MPFSDIYFFVLIKASGTLMPQAALGDAPILKIKLMSSVNFIRLTQ